MTDARNRVAIVDDDESVRRALRRLLQSAGIDSEGFGSGQTFLDSLSDRRPDCLLLDVRMGDINGEEVLENLAAMKCTVPVIIITAHEDDGNRLHARFPNTVACRVKPVNDDTLLNDIRSCCPARQA